MPAFDFQRALGTEAAPHLWEIVLRVGLAALLGAIVAFRPGDAFMGRARPRQLSAQSQTLIAASAR